MVKEIAVYSPHHANLRLALYSRTQNTSPTPKKNPFLTFTPLQLAHTATMEYGKYHEVEARIQKALHALSDTPGLSVAAAHRRFMYRIHGSTLGTKAETQR